LKDNVRRQASERIKEPDKFFTGESNIIRVVLDAIDGTVNFIHGIPLFCSGLAILVDGVPRVSAVYDPIHHVVYSGVLRGPDSNPEALAEARILQVAAGNQIDLVQLASDTETQKACEEILGVHLTRSKRDKLHEFLGARSLREESQLERLAHTFRGIYAFNSGIVAMTDVARGALGGFVNNTTNLWDVAPGEVLVRACGGKVTDISGATIDYSRYSADRRTSVVAGRTSSLHSKILNIVGA
jgi:myo-inositol-1(or 4)-monophosphatase